MGTIIKAIRKLIGGIARALSFLFVSLGLWLPILFSIGFFVCLGLLDVEFKGMVSAVFWGGLGFSVMLGLATALYTRGKRKRKAAAKAAAHASAELAKQSVAAPKSRRKRLEEAAQPQQGYYPYMPMQSQGVYFPNGMPQNSYAMPAQPPVQTMQAMQQPVPPMQQPMQQPVQAAQMPASAPYAPPVPPAPAPQPAMTTHEWEQKYFAAAEPQPARYERTASFDADVMPLSYGKTMTRTQEREADDRLGADELWRRLSGADVPDEQPLVYRMRRDPSLYVYEYTDRYQYWRRNETGMALERTEYKTNGVKNA